MLCHVLQRLGIPTTTETRLTYPIPVTISPSSVIHRGEGVILQGLLQNDESLIELLFGEVQQFDPVLMLPVHNFVFFAQENRCLEHGDFLLASNKQVEQGLVTMIRYDL